MSTSASHSVSSGGDVAPRNASGALSHEHDALLRARYRQWAHRYDQAFASYSERTLAEATRILGDPLPTRILDLACGTGLLIERLLRRTPTLQVTGVDLSEEMLARATARVEHNERVELLHGRAERIPATSGTFDAVVIANAFHLVEDQAAALRECRRVLRPAGSLVLVDWCRDAPEMRLLAWSLAATQRLRRRIVTLDQQQRLLANAGFRVVEARRFTAKPFWGLMGIRAISGG